MCFTYFIGCFTFWGVSGGPRVVHIDSDSTLRKGKTKNDFKSCGWQAHHGLDGAEGVNTNRKKGCTVELAIGSVCVIESVMQRSN
eukprot:3465449-Amphidinium_carterae.2